MIHVIHLLQIVDQISKYRKRGGRDRAGNSSQTVLISLFLSLARDRGIFCTTARSTGKKLEQLEPLSGLGDH